MKFTETPLKGSYIIEIEKTEDSRGFFSRVWDRKIFEENNLETNFAQFNISFSKKSGTIRGMHYQVAPYEEVKIVRCTSGAIYDVIIDMRHESSTYQKWFSAELSAKNHKMMYVPHGFAHGLQTLKDNTEIFYNVSQYYEPEYEGGIRWDDPVFDINWPLTPTEISEKDQNYPSFKDGTFY